MVFSLRITFSGRCFPASRTSSMSSPCIVYYSCPRSVCVCVCALALQTPCVVLRLDTARVQALLNACHHCQHRTNDGAGCLPSPSHVSSIQKGSKGRLSGTNFFNYRILYYFWQWQLINYWDDCHLELIPRPSFERSLKALPSEMYLLRWPVTETFIDR